MTPKEKNIKATEIASYFSKQYGDTPVGCNLALTSTMSGDCWYCVSETCDNPMLPISPDNPLYIKCSLEEDKLFSFYTAIDILCRMKEGLEFRYINNGISVPIPITEETRWLLYPVFQITEDYENPFELISI